ncbi:MAG TPA: hypothetical protein VI729_11560 [Anaerolineales bacterium]|nr:MAG: hypothetical protein A2Z37_15060 [Chloroflexi bacterium RBG_19FT_COMBO_62_14]HLE05232.1 hypothetical protein [Anaerolineales bacterium]
MNEPRSLRLTRLMIYLNALLWLLFALIIGAGAHPSYPIGSAYHLLMALAALMGTAFLFALAWLLRKPNPLAYWASVAVLAVTILMALFDEVGPADLAFILTTLLPLAFLIKNRSWYLQPSVPAEKPKRAA